MKLAALKYWNWFCILNQKERILLIPQVNCGSELLDVVWHPEPETSYPADPPKCTQAGFDPPKCTQAEIDPPNGSRSKWPPEFAFRNKSLSIIFVLTQSLRSIVTTVASLRSIITTGSFPIVNPLSLARDSIRLNKVGSPCCPVFKESGFPRQKSRI